MACKAKGNLMVLMVSMSLILCWTTPDIGASSSRSTTQGNPVADHSNSVIDGIILSTVLAEEFPFDSTTAVTVPDAGVDSGALDSSVAAGSTPERSSKAVNSSSLGGQGTSSDVTLLDPSTSTAETPSGSVRPAQSYSLIDSGSVSMEMAELIKIVCNYVALPLAVTGLVLNAFSIAVYVQPAMRSPCSSYLVSLGISQLLYLFLVSTLLIISLVYTTTGIRSFFFNVFSLHVPNFAIAALRRISFVTTLVISFERFLAVAFPFRSRTWGVSTFPKVITAIVFVLGFGVHVPQIFKYEIQPYLNGDFIAMLSPWWKENSEALGVFEVAIRVLFVYVPLSCTLLCNVLTILALRRHRKHALAMQSTQNADSTRRADTQRTRAIVVSTLLFVLLSLPTHLMSVLNNYHPQLGYGKQEHYLYMALTRVFTLLEVLSNLSDFVAFCTLCTRFREILAARLRCQGRRARPHSACTSSTCTERVSATAELKEA